MFVPRTSWGSRGNLAHISAYGVCAVCYCLWFFQWANSYRTGSSGICVSRQKCEFGTDSHVWRCSRGSLIGNRSLKQTNKQTNSVALVRERTIPTERPPPVGDVSANFCG